MRNKRLLNEHSYYYDYRGAQDLSESSINEIIKLGASTSRPQFSPRGWHSRGYLPHFDCGELAQSITFRLADSLPQEKLKQLKADLKCLPADKAKIEKRRQINELLDAGYGGCIIKQSRVALIVENSLLYYDGVRYRLLAWCIMPNHVHTLIVPLEPFSLSVIIQSWKSFTAKKICALLSCHGQIWQADYFDRFIRNDEHFSAVVSYIENNPVKAGLVKNAEKWKFSSAWVGRRPSFADETSALPDGVTCKPLSIVADETSALPDGVTCKPLSIVADETSALPEGGFSNK